MPENTFTKTGTSGIDLGGTLPRERMRTGRPVRPPSGQVTFWADGEDPVTALLMGQPESDGGVGGYEDIARAGSSPVAAFGGTPLRTLTLSLRFHHLYTTTGSVQDQVDALRAMGRPERPGMVPGGVWVIGEVPFKTTDLLRIDTMQLGERRYKPGSRLDLLWQNVTLGLSELVVASAVQKATPRRTRDASGKRRTRTVRTRYGDTLRLLGVAELGDATRWRDLRAWNPKLAKADPDALLRVGTKVLIK